MRIGLGAVALVVFLPAVAGGDVIFGSELGADALVRIDTSIPSGTVTGAFGVDDMTGLAADGTNVYGISADTGRLYDIDQTTGAATSFSAPLFENQPVGLAHVATENRLYVTNVNAPVALSWYDLDTDTSGTAGFFTGANAPAIEGLAYRASADQLYALDDWTDRVLILNRTTLATTALTAVLPAGNWRGLTYSVADDALYASRVGGDGTVLARINPHTGSFEMLGPVAGVGLFTQGLAAIPAPGALTLIGLAGLVAARRRR